jgi:hypothetical protein
VVAAPQRWRQGRGAIRVSFARRRSERQAPKSPRQNLREKSKFVSGFNTESTVQMQTEKYFASVFQNNMIHSCHPASTEGRFAIVTNVRRDAMDVICIARRAA